MIKLPLCLVTLCSLIAMSTICRGAVAVEDPGLAGTDGAIQKAGDPAVVPANRVADTIEPGTAITMENWQQYRKFMPDGMITLFEGKYRWKMPPDVRIEVGPTKDYPPPSDYVAATVKYSSQVKLIDLPNGGLTLSGYRAGTPFPNPQEPHRGWKVLANFWYRYTPRLAVDSYGSGCQLLSSGTYNCQYYEVVRRKLSYNSDPGAAETPDAGGKFITQWSMVTEPEQMKYTATLIIAHNDLSKPEDMYVFLPSLRRSQPLSTAARCSPGDGMDATLEDYVNGFNSNLTQMQVDYLGRRKILSLVAPITPQATFPGEVDMPLGWPMPSWGKWQVRDVDVISAKKLPSMAAGYCYGNRIMYMDSQISTPTWEELYDQRMTLWKIFAIFPMSVAVPGVGPVMTSGSDIEVIWDLRANHASYGSEPASGHPYWANDAAPAEYQDLPRYSTPSGLNLIMR